MKLSTQEVLDQINQARSKQAREVVLAETAESAFFSPQAREVYKNKNTKQCFSQSCEESERTCPSDSIGPSFQEVRPEGVAGVLPQGEEVSVIPGRENVTSRVYSGIEAYHCQTVKGTKLNLTLQTPHDAQLGVCVLLTAELKRQSRFREIKEYHGDDDYFKEFVKEAIDTLKDNPQEWCIGRAHARGKRSEWFANLLVIACLQHNVITQVKVCLDDEVYDIDLDLELNDNQQKYFHSGGRYGSITSQRKVPRLSTAERTLYR
jgi:hypothetical protein